MSKYTCVLCVFSSNRKTDYTRHIGTIKHLEKVAESTTDSNEFQQIPIQVDSTNKYKCLYCTNKYSTQSNVTKHMKRCGIKEEIIKEKDIIIKEILQEKDIAIKETEFNALKEKCELLQKEKDQYQKQLEKEKEQCQKEKEQYQRQLEMFTDLLKTKMLPSNVNNLTYIVNNYYSAPQLKKLQSYADIHDSDLISLVEVLVMYHQQGTLCKFIGDFLVSKYAKKNAEEQSIWNSDTSRLTYIVNDLQESGKIKWIMDKKGIKVKQYVITPLLEYLHGELQKYVKNNSHKTQSNVLNNLTAITEIHEIITKDILANEIVKYMAPYFCLMKDDDSVKQIEGPKKEIIIVQPQPKKKVAQQQPKKTVVQPKKKVVHQSKKESKQKKQYSDSDESETIDSAAEEKELERLQRSEKFIRQLREFKKEQSIKTAIDI